MREACPRTTENQAVWRRCTGAGFRERDEQLSTMLEMLESW